MHFTLVFVQTESEVLLGMKKRGFGVGKWNGFGGKVEKGEDLVEAAARELKEESNLDVIKDDLHYIGVVQYEDDQSQPRTVHLFTTNVISGELAESEEMRPKWFKYEHIPYKNMFPDSKFWLPLILNDCYIQAEFVYKNGSEIVAKKIKKLNMAKPCFEYD